MAPSLQGTPALEVELARVTRGVIGVDSPEDEGVELEPLESAEGVRSFGSRGVEVLDPGKGVIARPYFMADVEPGVRDRRECCCVVRSDLAEWAQQAWVKDFGPPSTAVSWPAGP